MAGHIVFAGININYIANEIKVSNPMTHNTSEYVGQRGSSTNFVSSQARVLTFTSISRKNEQSPHGRGHRINDYIWLAKTFSEKPKVLTSPSQSNINGNYILTGFDYTEDTGGNYHIDWEFKEVIKFNVTKKTFRVWGKAVSSNSKKKKTTTKTAKNSLNSNVKYLLKTCPLMSKGHTGKKCVKSLQKFLQSKGYYKGYELDGVYAIYTEQAVKGLQKQYKLKATGKWDKKTRAYWQKKYKYPTSINKASTGIVKSNIRV